MTGRCGSSTVAGLFNEHDVWCGSQRRGDNNNPRGYYENLKLKQALREWFGFDFKGDEPAFKPGWRKEVESIIHADGYHGGNWMYKHGAFFHKVWQEFNPKIIKVQRNTLDVFNSYKKCGFLNKYRDTEIIYIIQRQKNIMDNLPGVTINAERLFKHDYAELKAALEYCDIEFNQTITDRFMDG